jgi:hypothetical protein
MYELHGWVNLVDEGISKDYPYNQFLNDLKSRVDNIISPSTMKDMISLNDEAFLIFNAFTNRKRDLDTRVLEILSFISVNLPNAYGVIQDFDEDVLLDDNSIYQSTFLLKDGVVKREDGGSLAPMYSE